MNAQQTLTGQHRHCDDCYAECENLARQSDWAALAEHFARFSTEVEHHLSLEENTLFPAFESATGMLHGPTAVMRGEHQEMRELLEDMQRALDAQQRDVFLGLGETLLILTQQHNMKEENMLYPMCQAHVPDVDGLIEKALS